MSRGATLSLMGLYQWDNQILSQMVLPEGVDTDILFPDLLAECAEYEILYPEPETFKTVLKSWSGHRSKIWERIVNLAALEYDPISNYDRTETWTDTGKNSSSNSTIGAVDQTNKNYEAGYNANSLGTPPDMVQQEQNENNGTQWSANSGSGEGESTHTGHVYGNIGVTTTQQMMEQEINISDKIDVYAYIIADFKKRFCIPLF